MGLPDYLADGLRVVFCGTAAGTTSAARGHYYSGPGNRFWQYLFEAGLTPRLLTPADDVNILTYSIGLTDLAKNIAASSDRGLAGAYDAEGFMRKIARYTPTVVAFHGKEPAKHVSRRLGSGPLVRLGLQPWPIGSSHVFVVPSASAANRDPSRLEGKDSRVAWFAELRQLLDVLHA